MKDSIRFALAQIDTSVGDLAANAQKIVEYSAKAAHNDADVVVFPEMTVTGYPIEDLALRFTFRQAVQNSVRDVASQLEERGLGGLFVVVGTVGMDPVRMDSETAKPYNRLVVLHQGVVMASYDKHFLPNYGVFDEFRIFAPGQNSLTIEVGELKLGFAICEDIWQDGEPIATLAHEDIDVLVTINGSPFEEGKFQTRLDFAALRASQVGAPTIYLNQVGAQDDLVFDGGSFVVDQSGAMLERSPQFVEDLSFWDCNHKPANLSTYADELSADEQLYRACVLGLKDYARKNHFTGVVLGLSGGIDSALVASMAADAFGGQNVHGILMPSEFSSDGSKSDAVVLAENIGAVYATESIKTLFDAFQQQLHLSGIAKENIQARIRGVIVMAYSNQLGLLALATGNKSELACGYSTIYGDAVGGFAPIKDLLKTRVWQLAQWRNARAVRNGQVPPIPQNSITKAPSAELRPGQKDSDSLPDYALLDKVLEAYIEKAHGRADLLADGFDPQTVDTVMRLVDAAEWKRRQYPLGPKVTALAFGRDRRLPVTSAFRE